MFQFQIFKVIGDVSKESDVKNILDSTINHFGKLDILVSINVYLQSLLQSNSLTCVWPAKLKKKHWNVEFIVFWQLVSSSLFFKNLVQDDFMAF